MPKSKESKLKKLSQELKPIFDLELALGNKVKEIEHNKDGARMTIVFEESLHFAEIEKQLNIPNLVLKTVSTPENPFEGFSFILTGQELLGPATKRFLTMAEKLELFSPDLKPMLELELQLGNKIEQVNEWSSDDPRILVTLKKALHFPELKSQLQRPSTVEEWECWDLHYPLEAGLLCKKTGHTLAGPPPFFDRVRPYLEDLAKELAERRYDALAAKANNISADTFAKTVTSYGQKPVIPPDSAYNFIGSGCQEASVQAFPLGTGERQTWRVFFYVWTSASKETHSGLSFKLTFTDCPDGKLQNVIEDLSAGIIDDEQPDADYGVSAVFIERKTAQKSRKKDGKNKK